MTVYRWVQRFTPLLIDATRPCRHAPGDRWFVDETYVKVAGRWVYLYRAVDQYGQVIDVLVSEKRDLVATRRFSARALEHAGLGRSRAGVSRNARALLSVGAARLSPVCPRPGSACATGRTAVRLVPIRRLAPGLAAVTVRLPPPQIGGTSAHAAVREQVPCRPRWGGRMDLSEDPALARSA